MSRLVTHPEKARLGQCPGGFTVRAIRAEAQIAGFARYSCLLRDRISCFLQRTLQHLSKPCWGRLTLIQPSSRRCARSSEQGTEEHAFFGEISRIGQRTPHLPRSHIILRPQRQSFLWNWKTCPTPPPSLLFPERIASDLPRAAEGSVCGAESRRRFPALSFVLQSRSTLPSSNWRRLNGPLKV